MKMTLEQVAERAAARDRRVRNALAVRAFQDGFAEGAAGKSAANKRHVVDPDTHHHWRAGFEAGVTAVARAKVDYGKGLP